MGTKLRDRTNEHDDASCRFSATDGLIEESPDASLGMCGLTRDFGRCLSRSAAKWERVFHGHAKIGPTRRLPIVFFPMGCRSARQGF